MPPLNTALLFVSDCASARAAMPDSSNEHATGYSWPGKTHRLGHHTWSGWTSALVHWSPARVR